MNGPRTESKSDAWLTQVGSGNVPVIPLPDCASHLMRLYPTLPVDKRPLASTLAMQCRNYPYNPAGVRPIMLTVIERLEAINADDLSPHPKETANG